MILNINKPIGWTSFDVVAKLRGVLRTKKIGHAGTLDPLAEGVLLVLTDNDTKNQDSFMKQTKEYITEIAFGITTPSYDMEFTPELSEKYQDFKLTPEVLKSALATYIGEFEQTAPPYSAKKVEGKVLYKEARKGRMEGIVLPKKKVTIFAIDVLEIGTKKIETDKGIVELPVAKLRVETSSGVYVRSLAHDLGIDLGVGGVMISLVRSKIGDYKIEDAKSIEFVIEHYGK